MKIDMGSAARFRTQVLAILRNELLTGPLRSGGERG
jgi:hypothetical protein